MSATLLSELSVAQARRRLNDTTRLSNEQTSELQAVVDRFHAARPRGKSCVACGSMIWSEHTTTSVLGL
jgi:hypothetical protein